jgi:multidrug resistance efflux pump
LPEKDPIQDPLEGWCPDCSPYLIAISARIAGTVSGVYIDNNQAVNAGQLCVELDPADYQNALDQSKAS